MNRRILRTIGLGGAAKFLSAGLVRRLTVRPLQLRTLLHQTELVPQAVVEQGVDFFALRVDSEIVKDHDDLDEYVGAGFSLGGIPFAIMHYRGHPPGTSTIYLPYEISDVEKITKLIARITSWFNVPPQRITWQRQDDLRGS